MRGALHVTPALPSQGSTVARERASAPRCAWASRRSHLTGSTAATTTTTTNTHPTTATLLQGIKKGRGLHCCWFSCLLLHPTPTPSAAVKSGAACLAIHGHAHHIHMQREWPLNELGRGCTPCPAGLEVRKHALSEQLRLRLCSSLPTPITACFLLPTETHWQHTSIILQPPQPALLCIH